MFLILSKTLSFFIDPLGAALCILAVGFVFAVFPRRPKISATLLICGFMLILLPSLPAVSYFLVRGLESQYAPSLEYERPDAVVLLGGSTTGKLSPRIHVEVNHSGSRILNAVRVFRQSGASCLALTGGIVEMISSDDVSEASAMFELLHELFDIDTTDVIIENKSQNTRENAIFTKKAMEDAGLGNNIILVTSAYHMPRAAAVFRKAGFNVTPAPTGFLKNDSATRGKPLTWLPSAHILFESSIAIREYVGIAVYKRMGWI